MVADGLLALYEATFDRGWLEGSRAIADAMLALFWDPDAEAFFDTGADHEALVVRPRSLFDSAVPCGTSVAADVLLRLALLLDEPAYERPALSALRAVLPLMTRYPSGAGRFLSALDFYLGPPVEVAIVWPGGPRPGADLPPAALAREAFHRYLPSRVMAGAAELETGGVKREHEVDVSVQGVSVGRWGFLLLSPGGWPGGSAGNERGDRAAVEAGVDRLV